MCPLALFLWLKTKETVTPAEGNAVSTVSSGVEVSLVGCLLDNYFPLFLLISFIRLKTKETVTPAEGKTVSAVSSFM